MKEKIKKIFIIILMLISIGNIYNVYNCYPDKNPIYYGGLESLTFYYIGFTIILVFIQIINIILLIRGIKYNKNLKITIGIVIVNIIITYFIPIYGIEISNHYINLYRIPLYY